MTNKKQYLLAEAERQYIYKFMTIDEIASRLNVHTKTITRWKEQGDWNTKRKEFLKSKQTFHEDLYVFCRKLMNDIMEDMESGEKIDPGRMYAFCRIIPMFTKVKSYEDLVYKPAEKEKQKGLSEELIAQIERDVLGIMPENDEPTEEE
ncbi:hypothetical protein J6I39_06785 [bacterium]|nr:hypothetical protein [bacterium]